MNCWKATKQHINRITFLSQMIIYHLSFIDTFENSYLLTLLTKKLFNRFSFSEQLRLKCSSKGHFCIFCQFRIDFNYILRYLVVALQQLLKVALAIQLTQVMQSSIDILPSLSHKIIADNPQIEEQRCRICYEETKPLITLCECSGSIAYVHEDCILDWITKKMESAEVVEIPKCEICRSTYSAKLKIGRKKICHKLLLGKIKELKLKQILLSLIFLLGAILAVVAASKAVFDVFAALLTFNVPTENTTATQSTDEGLLMLVFKNLVFPLMFLKYALIHGKRQMKIIQDSKVQIVEVTLNPKLVIKH